MYHAGMTMHPHPHPDAGRTIMLARHPMSKPGTPERYEPVEYWVEDWADRVLGGRSWMMMDGNIGCLQYAMRSSMDPIGVERIGIDNEVVAGKIGALSYLVHQSEIDWSLHNVEQQVRS